MHYNTLVLFTLWLFFTRHADLLLLLCIFAHFLHTLCFVPFTLFFCLFTPTVMFLVCETCNLISLYVLVFES